MDWVSLYMWNVFKSGEQTRLKASIIPSGWNFILPLPILCDGFWLLNTVMQKHSALVPLWVCIWRQQHWMMELGWYSTHGINLPYSRQFLYKMFRCRKELMRVQELFQWITKQVIRKMDKFPFFFFLNNLVFLYYLQRTSQYFQSEDICNYINKYHVYHIYKYIPFYFEFFSSEFAKVRKTGRNISE